MQEDIKDANDTGGKKKIIDEAKAKRLTVQDIEDLYEVYKSCGGVVSKVCRITGYNARTVTNHKKKNQWENRRLGQEAIIERRISADLAINIGGKAAHTVGKLLELLEHGYKQIMKNQVITVKDLEILQRMYLQMEGLIDVEAVSSKGTKVTINNTIKSNGEKSTTIDGSIVSEDGEVVQCVPGGDGDYKLTSEVKTKIMNIFTEESKKKMEKTRQQALDRRNKNV